MQRTHDGERWPEFKDRILKHWANLPASELAATEGDWERIQALISAEYGLSRAEAARELDALLTGNSAYAAAPTSTRSPSDRRPGAARRVDGEDEEVRRRMSEPTHRTN